MADMIRIRSAVDGWSGGPGLTTFYFNPSGVTVDAAMITGVTGRVRAYFDAWKAFMPTGFTATVNPTADVMDAATGQILAQVTAGAAPSVVVGTGGTAAGPGFVTAIGKLQTSSFVNGRRLQGRTFVSPLAAAFTDSLQPEGGLRAAIQAGLVAVQTAAGGPILVVWHRPVNKTGGFMSAVVNVATSGEFGSLRSRR